MTNQISNKKIEEFFNSLIDSKTKLTNELFLEGLKIQKEEMKEYFVNNSDADGSLYLEDRDLADYVAFLNKNSGLLFDENFDIVIAQNDRADAVFYSFSEKSEY